MSERRKRGGHLVSKHRFLAAQIEAYLADDLWLELARHANAMADRLAAGLAAADLVPDVRPGDKRFGQTGSPTRVLAVRDVTPERARELFRDPAEAARRTRELLSERPATRTAWEKPERLVETPGRAYDCWSTVELVEGRIARVSLELLGKSRELAGKLGGRVVALVLGHALQ